jgi:acyl-CoA thioester hydrolase
VGEPFRHTLRVRYNECDPQGVVFNANYLTYFDVLLTELWRRIGGYAEMVEAGQDLVVAEAVVRYRAPLRFDDEFEGVVSIGRLGETSLVVSFSLERDGAVCAEGENRYVFVTTGSGAKASIPTPVRVGLSPYAVASG